MPKKEWVLVSENINGRTDLQCRNGLIFLSYDLGLYKISEQYINLSEKFAQFIEGEGMDYERTVDALNTCNEIAKIIGLR